MKITQILPKLIFSVLSTALIGSSVNAAPVSGRGTWETTLQARDLNGDSQTDAFYDTSLNITWLANADLLRGYGWGSAMAFAANLSFGGFDDWRLPKVVDTGTPLCNYSNNGTDCGINVQTKAGDTVYSEMAHLWYVALGNCPALNPYDYTTQPYMYESTYCKSAQILRGLTNTGYFQGLGLSDYWTLTRNEPSTGGNVAFIFTMSNGYQDVAWQDMGRSSMFVRDGDVALPAQIPEPESITLVLTALGILGLISRRRRGSILS